MNTILNGFEPKPLDYSEIKDLDSSDVEKALELEAKIKLKAKQKKQFADMTDTMYYAVVVFGNRSDKKRWLESLSDDVDVEAETFIDGYRLAKDMGVEIEMTASLPEPHYVKQFKIKKNVRNIRR
jgi:hypothetical protein